MAPRKTSTKAAKTKAATQSTPTRQSARNANKRFNAEYGSDETPIKDEEGSSPAKKANIGAKRAAPSGTPQSSKKVKIEVPGDEDEDVDVKAEGDEDTGLPSPEETLSDEDASELSDAKEEPESDFSGDDVKPKSKSKAKAKKGSKATKSRSTKVKSEPKSASPSTPKSKSKPKTTTSPADKAAQLQAKKLKSFAQFSKTSPFPDFPHPTPDEARLAHKILQSLHGERVRPETVVARSDRAGCGDSPSVLDALVRTILSQNTSDSNSTRAKLSMDKVYGGSDKWDAIVEGGQGKLEEAIRGGGLSQVKSKVIISILEQTREKYGAYSLDHLFDKSDEEAMTELIGMKGVGPKTASCVLLFCLKRESFAVDTHVYRIAGLLGWRPPSASRDETHAHLEVRIPDEEKYGLHILMVGHGKKCDECKAGGRSVGNCELRKAFRQKKLKGDVGDEVKEEEEEEVKEDGGNVDEVKKEVVDEWEGGQEDYVHGMQGGKKQSSSKVAKKDSQNGKKQSAGKKGVKSEK